MKSPASPFRRLHAMLFDLDGTLVETHIDFAAMTQAVSDMAARADVPADVAANHDVLSAVEAFAAYLSSHGKDGNVFKAAAWDELARREWSGCAHPSLVPGADTLLRHLQTHGIKIGIVTRNCRAVSLWMLEQFPLPYDVLLSRDDTPRFKPAPEHLWHALTLLQVPPADAGMCGDHWMDIKAGDAARCAATLGVLGVHAESWFAPCPPTHMVADLVAALPLFA